MDYIDDLEKAEENRDILKGFFSVLKDSDPYLRFFLITGVSKFSKVSLFSDLNNLEDITLAPSAATLTGYTQAELEHHFEEPFREKPYGSPFLGKDKEVIALGINFSSADKEVAEWQAVPYEELLVEG